ncbi:MAG: hypothetical protein AAGH15_13970 [Myxococcota bacterium]
MTRWAPLCLALGACAASVPAAAPGAPEPPPLEVQVRVVTAAEQREAYFAQEAELVARRVEARRRGGHGELPPLERTPEAMALPEAWPQVRVRNATDFGLIVWFSGPCPRTVALAPRAEHTEELCAGRYELVAELDERGFQPFVGRGDDLEEGGAYQVTFFLRSR